MCTLLLYRRPFAGVDLGVAANRDELYARPAGSFGALAADPLVVGGQDPEQGGTWLAASGAGFVVAVTNARLRARRSEDQRSRGLLARDLAVLPSAAAAALRLDEEDLERYAPVNVVVASREGFVVATNTPRPRRASLELASLGIGNLPLFTEDGRVRSLLEMGTPREEAPGSWAARLRGLLERHEAPSACHHQRVGGTVSGTVMLVRPVFARSEIWHVEGPPCRVPWTRVDLSEIAVAPR